MFKTFFLASLGSFLIGNIAPTFFKESQPINQNKIELFDSVLVDQYKSMNKGTALRLEFKHLIDSGKAKQIGTFICTRKDSNNLSEEIKVRFLSDIPEENFEQVQIQQTNVEIIQELAIKKLCK